jgi:copper chaperone
MRSDSKVETAITDSPKPTEVDALVYIVEGMSCGHCELAVTEEVARVPGVDAVAVDLQSKRVTVRGQRLDDEALRRAIDDAGYEAVAG